MRTRLFPIALLALSLSTACLGSTEPIVIPTIETTGFDASLGITLSQFTKTASGLYYRDISIGTGHSIAVGDTARMNYVGSLTNGFVFDRLDTAIQDSLLKFKVGEGHIISGFEEGVVGMKVGGQRQLIIPPALGYGGASDGVIPPYAILVFTVKAVSIWYIPS